MNLLLGSLLLAGVCSLGDATNIPVMANFDNQRIAKAWYPLLSIPTGQLRSVQFHPFQLVAQPNGNLKYRIRVTKNGRCGTEDVMLNKQSQPGDYVTSVPSTLRFVETDYNTYFIAYITRGSGNLDTFLALAGTQPNVTPALETKFRTVANSLGVTGGILHSVLLATC
ncbi:ficolin-1-like [Crotalus adamanteus]|uniref:Ficolin-1-like n=1 Tax=Crotalus adamanteus TaxID=8729 RepID=A0AAW1AR00_CROAD